MERAVKQELFCQERPKINIFKIGLKLHFEQFQFVQSIFILRKMSSIVLCGQLGVLSINFKTQKNLVIRNVF